MLKEPSQSAPQDLFLVSELDAALAIYLCVPAIGWAVLAFQPQGLFRFGLQWQALGLGIACSAPILLLRSRSWQAYRSFLLSIRYQSLIAVVAIWLMVMAAVHGVFGAQQEGLVSCLLFVLGFPLACFAWSHCSEWLRRLFVCILVALLLLENVFLVIYLFRGLGFNSEVLSEHSFPRIFLNIRDGNTLALGVSVAGFSMLARRSGCWVGFSLMMMSMFNGWITAGRGLFLSILVGLLLAVFCVKRGREGVPAGRLLVLCGLALLCSWLIYQSVVLLLGIDGSSFRSMMDRFAGEADFQRSGRLVIWAAWIREGLASNWLFGSGLGVRPEMGMQFESVYTPHNIFVQLVAEGGVFSVFAVAVLVALLFRSGPSGLVGRSGTLAYSLCLLFIWLNVSAMLFWPMGAWLVSNFGCVLFDPSVKNKEASLVGASFIGVWLSLLIFCLVGALVFWKCLVWY